MDKLILSLGPAFAAGLAVQQLLELIDRLFEQLLKSTGLSIDIDKKLILGLISLFFGFLLSIGAGLRVLRPLGIQQGDFLDVIVTALIISAGTESLNAIVKFLGYVKEDKKVTTRVNRQEIVEDGE